MRVDGTHEGDRSAPTPIEVGLWSWVVGSAVVIVVMVIVPTIIEAVFG